MKAWWNRLSEAKGLTRQPPRFTSQLDWEGTLWKKNAALEGSGDNPHPRVCYPLVCDSSMLVQPSCRPSSAADPDPDLRL